IDPVCGCNGKTYPSDCDAATHGMAMDHAGKCPTPATSSLTYDNTVEPWPGGANILEGSASFVSSPVDPAEVFTVPAPFETNKSFVTFVIYKQNNSPEHLLVTLSRTEMGGTLPATVTLQGPPDNTGLSRAERYYDTLLVGHLTGAVTITAFDEGGVPGAPVTLVLSGDALTFSWVDQ
ncbi:MAG TPA: Kazal-type serine protease inhibitor, partial [bacterium]|nr:Kazal-type serine protease inhibitor [bacterium]